MKLLFIISIAIFLIKQVISNCHLTLTYYYDCKLYSVYPSKSKYRKYDFNNLSDDTFFNKTLNKINTFQKAMDHFKTIFNEINSCNQTWCDCVRHHIYDGPNYTFFFNSSLLFPQMVSILNKVKTSNTLMSFDEIAFHGFDLDEFYKGFPFLNEFCLKYDFSYEMFYFYQETYECEMAAFDASHKCMASYFILRYLLDDDIFYSLSTHNFVFSQIEQYLSCLATYMPPSICPQDVKICVLLTYLYDYPKVIRGSNLTIFIHSIANKKAPIKKHIYIMENIVTSLKKVREKCSLEIKNYAFFSSNWLKIIGSVFKSNGISVISKASIEFFYNKNVSQIYTVSLDSFPNDFNSKNTTKVQGPNNQKWLEMIATEHYNDGFSNHTSKAVFIYDHSRNSTVVVHDCTTACNIDLVVSEELFSNSSGIFVNGCYGN